MGATEVSPLITLMRIAELLSVFLLLYLGLSLSFSSQPLLMFLFLAEAAAALYVTWAIGKRPVARVVALVLAVAILLPMAGNVIQGAYHFSMSAGPAVALSFVLVALLAGAQVLCVAAVLLSKRVRAASA